GTQYEPYIYAALSSSKVMLTVSSSRENIEAAWVKNEWSRYLTLRQSDAQKTLIPLYFSMPRSDLPEEFAILMAQDMKKEGFEQELIRGIKKLIPLPVLKVKRRKQILKATGVAAACLVLATGVAAAIIIPKEMEAKRLAEEEMVRASEAAALEKANEDAYQAAMILFDSADYAAAETAFIALGDYKDSPAMAIQCVSEQKYQEAMEMFDNADYTSAETVFIALGDYKDAAYMAARCPIQPEYDAAMQLYYDGNYPAATWAFRDVGEYLDAAQMQDKAEQAWRDKLATVATQVLGWESSGGKYFITANGDVKTVLNSPGTAHEGIEINSHGKISSIMAGSPLFALYDDGYVYNSSKNNNMETDWEDVIQITPELGFTSAALKSDGTVVFGTAKNKDDEEFYSWLEPVSEWKDIVSLSWSIERRGTEGSLSAAILIGVDIKGDVHCVYYANAGMLGQLTDTEIVKGIELLHSMHNVQTVEVCFGATFYTRELNCAVLDREGNLLYYSKGETQKQEKTDYKDVLFGYDYEGNMSLLGLDSKGRVQNLNTGNTVEEDVVYIDGAGYMVKQSGTIVGVEGGKTKVRDTWLEGNG
ncbi:MAG: TIR domain-containing protein, partial [Oscillospiraceae bacterium]|nr:TIR domain-containing protein [Oscillospiraceae bacterium]